MFSPAWEILPLAPLPLVTVKNTPLKPLAKNQASVDLTSISFEDLVNKRRYVSGTNLISRRNLVLFPHTVQ